SGNGVVVISTYLMNNTAGSVNQNHVVVTNRIVIGNNTLYTSVFGNPSPSDIQADGSIDKATAQDIHMTDRADNVSNLITLGAGNSVRMVEVYFKTIAISLSSVSSGGGHYSRAIF